MTATEIKNLPSNKIKTINKKVGILATAMQFKIMKDHNNIVVITRDGLLKYMGNAQYAFGWGVKNKDYKVFKTAELAAKYIS